MDSSTYYWPVWVLVCLVFAQAAITVNAQKSTAALIAAGVERQTVERVAQTAAQMKAEEDRLGQIAQLVNVLRSETATAILQVQASVEPCAVALASAGGKKK